jgi:hypothetical protein
MKGVRDKLFQPKELAARLRNFQRLSGSCDLANSPQ